VHLQHYRIKYNPINHCSNYYTVYAVQRLVSSLAYTPRHKHVSVLGRGARRGKKIKIFPFLTTVAMARETSWDN